MGVFAVPLLVLDTERRRVRNVEVTVDTGGSYTVLPGSLLRELEIEPEYKDTFELGDGRSIEQEVGFARIIIAGKSVVTPVVFADDNVSPLLGAVTLQILSLTVDSRGEQLVPRVNVWYEFAAGGVSPMPSLP